MVQWIREDTYDIILCLQCQREMMTSDSLWVSMCLIQCKRGGCKHIKYSVVKFVEEVRVKTGSKIMALQHFNRKLDGGLMGTVAFFYQ